MNAKQKQLQNLLARASQARQQLGTDVSQISRSFKLLSWVYQLVSNRKALSGFISSMKMQD